ncbi:MAG: gliding motility-associated C-terminal domain-containing protein [Cyclobacteriaceae bacterium]|nr:gliding motility-associated C-terminal domain-containing protein [Cyclobacteriaceae bacterium]
MIIRGKDRVLKKGIFLIAILLYAGAIFGKVNTNSINEKSLLVNTVTINQAITQPDPVNTGPVVFEVVFGEAVTGFDATDVDLILSTTPGALIATVVEIAPNDGTTFAVTVSGMTGPGIVEAFIPAGAANLVAGGAATTASTSTDNQITICDAPNFSTNISPNTSCDPAGYNGVIDVSVTNPTATSYSYSLSGPAGTINRISVTSSESFINLAPGNYDIIVKDDNTGCDQIGTVVLADALVLPVVTFTNTTGNTSCTTPSGTATAEATDPTPPANGYTYTWYEGTDITTPFTGPVSGPFGENIFSLVAGDYTVIARNLDTGCDSAPTTVNIPDNSPALSITVDANTPNTSCGASANGALAITPSGGASYAYDWVGPGTFTSTAQDITGLPEGDYTLTLKDVPSGCLITQVITVVNAATNPAITVDTNTPVSSCITPDGALAITVTGGSGGFTFAWTGPGGFTAATEDIAGLQGGTYKLTVTDNGTGCVSTPFSVDVVDNAGGLVVTQVSASDNKSCANPNGAIGISINGITNPAGYTITWYAGLDNTGTIVGINVTSLTGLQGGDYHVEVVDNGTACTGTMNATIAQLAVLPVVEIVSTFNNLSCSSPTGAAEIIIDGGADISLYSISWKDKAGTEIAVNTLMAMGLSGQDYTVTVTRVGTDCKIPTKVSIVDNIVVPTDAAIAATTTTICAGETLDLSVVIAGGTAPFTIEIDNGIGVVSNYNNGDPIPVSPASTTTYSIVSVNDTNGCIPAVISTSSVKIGVNANPSPPSNVTFSNITGTSMRINWINGSGSGRLVIMKEAAPVDISPASGTPYTADPVFGNGTDLGGGNFVIFSGSATAVTVNGLKEGVEYHVAVHELNGLCYTSASAIGSARTVGCAVLPDVTASPAEESICNGGTTGIGLNSTDPLTTYDWTVVMDGVSGALDGSGNSIAQALTLTTAASGTATYTITPILSTCTGTPITVIVTVLAEMKTYAITGGGAICNGSGNKVNIGLDGSDAGINYVLKRGTSTVETVLGTGNTLSFTTTDIPGDYTVEASSNCGVLTMGGTVAVIIDPQPQLSGTISGNTTVCQGESGLVFSVADPGNVTFNWILPAGFTLSSGDGTAQVTIDLATSATGGDISVTSTNSCGTSAPITTAVTVNPGFDANIVTQDQIYATRDAAFYVDASVPVESVNWDMGDGTTLNLTDATHAYATPGTYVVTANVLATDGCTRSVQVNANVIEVEKILIRNVVTANGDGVNDLLHIDNIDFYLGNQVVVIDRWGVKVAEFNNYANDWDFSNAGGEILPAGHYLCIVKIPEQEEVYSMTITLLKE